MKKMYCIAVLFATLFFLQLVGYSEELTPIDKKEQNCMDRAVSTFDMLTCTNSAIDDWNDLIKDYYDKLYRKLPIDDKKILTDSQTAWNKYKDTEFEFINRAIKGTNPTMFINVQSGYKRAIVRNRAQLLKEYYDTLNF